MHSDICKSFVDHCLWQVIPDLLQCTFYAALCNRAGHYIYLSICLSVCLSVCLSIYLYLSSFSSSPNGCLPYFYIWCGISANLGCRFEMRCTWLAANTGRKNRHLGTIAQLCWAISSQLRHVSTIGKKTC